MKAEGRRQKAERNGLRPFEQAGFEIVPGILTERECDEDNGALRIIPGSHAHGILSDAEIDGWKRNGATICTVVKGGALLMRPLVLHASSPASQPRHRRVLHIEYASGDLPGGLRWFRTS